MNALRHLPAAVALTLALTGLAGAADLELPGGLEQVIGQLNLSAAQKARIASIYAEAQPGFRSLESASDAAQRLLALTPPTDPDYAVVLAAAKTNAANAVQIRSDLWTHIFGELTPDQRAQLPAIFAAHKVASSSRKLAWRSIHSAS
jgi:Spy/CpxP family protein refolding chaperone